MTESCKPLVVVVGATSKQGRSVVTSLIGSGRFRVRALTRAPGSPQARAIAAMGVEVATAALEPGRRSEFVDAFRSAQGAFLMTPPVAPPSNDEFTLGCQLADAAVEAGIEHLVFSTLENVHDRSAGTKYAPHFTDKARVADHIRTLPVPHTFVMLAFFYTNAMEYYPPRRDGDTTLMPFYLPEDFRAPFVDPTTKYPKPPYPSQSQPWPGLASEMNPRPDHGETSYKGSGRLLGRKALITGGDSGMGRAAAIAYAREGADVVISY